MPATDSVGYLSVIVFVETVSWKYASSSVPSVFETFFKSHSQSELGDVFLVMFLVNSVVFVATVL